jgi:hypothetical protein
MDELQDCIVGLWIHSHEEDTPEARVYRHRGYSFPPARGRRGFELREGGAATTYEIAPTDGSRPTNGHWMLEAPGRIRIESADEQTAPQTLEVVSCDEEILRVKQ